MQISQLTCAYFPGKVIFLDDQSAFLDSLSLRLPDSLNFQMYTDPNTALHAIAAQPSLQSNVLQKIDVSDLEKPVDCAINVNVKSISNILFQAKRFAHYTVLIVDQFMPKIKGIAVCEKLSQHPIKKMMLTGKTNNQLAVNAFNKGIIDHFLAKDEQDFIEHICSTIVNLQQKYFQQWSAPIIEAIKILSDSFLRSTKFMSEFNAFLNQYNICEFYLIDTMGSYIGLDSDGNTYCFLVKNEMQIDYYIETVKNSCANKDILILLEEKRKLPYFFNKKQERADTRQWKNMLYDINKRIDIFYISMVKIAFPSDIKEEILAFNQYTKNNYSSV